MYYLDQTGSREVRKMGFCVRTILPKRTLGPEFSYAATADSNLTL